MSAEVLLNLTVVPDRERVTLVAAGEVDMSTAPDLTARLRELWATGCDSVELDLHQVTFMDSTGLHALITADRQARDAGRTLTLIDGSFAVRRLLQLTAVDSILPIRRPAPHSA